MDENIVFEEKECEGTIVIADCFVCHERITNGKYIIIKKPNTPETYYHKCS